jgi:hypothetical protein
VTSATRRRLPWYLLALMLVIARTADAHAHLCFDGREAPSSIHFSHDIEHPCETGKDSGHSGDKDVKLFSDVLLKKSQASDAWLPAVLPSGARFIAQSFAGILDSPTSFAPTTPTFLRPPPRGPPA